MISRSDWGARPPKRTASITDKTGGVVLHYTAVDSSDAVHWPDCYDRWQRHQNYHMDVRGWNDLAYNFGVCKDGFVFEGRGWDARNGANTPENGKTLSVAVDVDGDQPIDPAVVNNVNALIAEAVDRGWARRLRGHYEVSTTGTACPGATLKGLLDDGTIHPSLLDTPPQPAVKPVSLVDEVVLPETPYRPVVRVSSTVSALRMQDWARSHDASRLFVELAVPARAFSLKYGVNAAVVYAVMGHETAFGRFGGIVDETFHNWGGIKTADGGSNTDPNAHHRFNSHQLGVLAVVQHVAGYAGIKIPDEEILDPRYHLLEGMRIAAIPSDSWAWASDKNHDDKVAAYAREMMINVAVT